MTTAGIGKKAHSYPELSASITYEIKLARLEIVEVLAGKLDNIAAQFRVNRLSHSTERAIRKQLKIDAVKAAKEKSRYLAEAIGETAGQALTIVEPTEGEEANGFLISQRYEISNTGYNYGITTGIGGHVPAKKLKYRYEASVVFALK